MNSRGWELTNQTVTEVDVNETESNLKKLKQLSVF